MTSISNEELETAAFWEEGICLDCEAVLDTLGGECPNCGGLVLPAITIQKVLELFQDNDLPF